MLPPCLGNLKLHIKRASYVSYIFRHANNLQLDLEPSSLHGWTGTCVQWMEVHFPTNIHSVLITANSGNETKEAEDESDDDCEEVEEEDDRDVELDDFS